MKSTSSLRSDGTQAESKLPGIVNIKAAHIPNNSSNFNNQSPNKSKNGLRTSKAQFKLNKHRVSLLFVISYFLVNSKTKFSV